MPALPANFIKRGEVQGLILRLSADVGPLDAELRSAVDALIRSALLLDGLMAELPASSHPNDKALVPLDFWTTCWIDSCNLCHGLDTTVVVSCQHAVTSPVRFMKTGLHRVTIGDQSHVSSDVQTLRRLTLEYLSSKGVDDDVIGKILDTNFPE